MTEIVPVLPIKFCLILIWIFFPMREKKIPFLINNCSE